MMLRLTIENVPSLASGDPVEMLLAEHGLVIGRAAHADWTLPDPNNHISSLQCEIDYRDGRYILTDRSTNGTFMNGAPTRLPAPVQLRDGDLLQIGPYQIRVEELADGGAPAAPASSAGLATGGGMGFGGVDWHSSGGDAAKPIAAQAFGREPPRPLFQTAQDPLMAAFAAPKAQTGGGGNPFGVGDGAAEGAPNPFGIGGGAAAATPNPFGIAAAPAAPPPAADPFGTNAPPPATGNPFGIAAAPGTAAPSDPFGVGGPAPAPQPAPPPPGVPASDPFGMGAAARQDPFAGYEPGTPAATPVARPASPAAAPADPWALLGGANAIDFTPRAPAAAPPAPAAAPPAPAASAVAPAAQAAAIAPVQPAAPPAPSAAAAAPEPNGTGHEGGDALYDRLIAATGLAPRDLGGRAPERVVDVIGQLLRQTADGLFRLLEARTRVRHQFGVGAQVTVFQREGNNPLKWTRSPEEALKQMIGEPARGFLEGTQAVQGAFEDLQAHEMAMIAAMQEAMGETIRRFAPDTIRARISARGWLKSVLPGSREATLWRAYESEFKALADESEAAYLDLFAKQFKKAYERIVSAGR